MSEERRWLATLVDGALGAPTSPDWLAWLHELFATLGAIPEEELTVRALAAQRERALDACERVRADVLRTTGRSVTIEVVEEDFGLVVLCDGERSNHDGGALFSIDSELLAAEVAGSVQDVLMDRWTLAWPECPQHGRVLDPALRDGRAVWSCPSGHVTAVGEL